MSRAAHNPDRIAHDAARLGDIPLRADARRNRDQIIVTATEIFAESGLDVAMEAIARRAGVGVGTLYRRFPDRGNLLAAVAARAFHAVLDDLRDAVDSEPDAWHAFVRLVTGSENLRLTVQLAFPSPHSWGSVHVAPESSEVHVEMMATLEQLVRDAQTEGSVRTDIGAGDALQLVSLILGTSPADSDPTEQVWAERWLWLALDGLRANSGSPLPGSPVTVQHLMERALRIARPEDD